MSFESGVWQGHTQRGAQPTVWGVRSATGYSFLVGRAQGSLGEPDRVKVPLASPGFISQPGYSGSCHLIWIQLKNPPVRTARLLLVKATWDTCFPSSPLARTQPCGEVRQTWPTQVISCSRRLISELEALSGQLCLGIPGSWESRLPCASGVSGGCCQA